MFEKLKKKRICFSKISISLIWYIPISLLVAFLVSLLYYNILDGNFGTMTEMGLFGDSFGALNAIFSGVSLGGVVISLFLQRRDLQATLEEMNESTKTQTKTTETLEKQLLSIDRNNTLRILEKRLSDPSSFKNEEDRNYAELIINKLTDDIISDSNHDIAIIPRISAYTSGTFPNDLNFQAGIAFQCNVPMEINAREITPDDAMTKSTLRFEMLNQTQSGNYIKVDSKDKAFNFKYGTEDSYNEIEFEYKLKRNDKVWRQKLILIKDTDGSSERKNYRSVLGQPYIIES